MVEGKTFAPRMIDKLRKEYGNIEKLSYKQGEKLKNMVDKYPNDMELGARIRWYIRWLYGESEENPKDKKWSL